MILGIRIDKHSAETAIEQARDFLSDGKQHMIFTPNPEMVVAAQKDTYFREVLNKGSLNICDGRGIQFVSSGKLTRISGIDFLLELCTIASMEGKSVYLLGSGDETVVMDAAAALREKFPSMTIAGYHPGPKISMKTWEDKTLLSYDGAENNAVVKLVNAARPDILFVAFGHGKQEKWIAENLKKMPSVQIAMGVGGAFDFISGRVKRAPRFLRLLWLEWIWRLLQEPRRAGRIWNATINFLFLFYFKDKK